MGINEDLQKHLKAGPKEQCTVSGLFFPVSEMVQDENGLLVFPQFKRQDFGTSKQRKGPGWEKGEPALPVL